MSLNADLEESEDSMYTKNRKSASFKLQTKAGPGSEKLSTQEVLLNPMSQRAQPVS